MAKKNKAKDTNRRSKSNQGHDRNPNQGKDSNKGKSDRLVGQGNDMSAGGKFKGNDISAAAGGKFKGNEMMNEGSQVDQGGWLKEDGKSMKESWIPENSTSPTTIFSRLKNACLPKALMLTLPFIALGVYLIVVL